jgi:hypothetical protein
MTERTPKPKPSVRYPRTRATWPCVFDSDFVREQVDPRILTAWEAQRSDKPKWGDLRTTFRREHCQTINPYGSETCPFRAEDCAIAFLKGVTASLGARNAHGYFIRVARSMAAARADEGVRMRAEKARMRTGEGEEADRGGVE